jgi:hypothetical protein
MLSFTAIGTPCHHPTTGSASAALSLRLGEVSGWRSRVPDVWGTIGCREAAPHLITAACCMQSVAGLDERLQPDTRTYARVCSLWLHKSPTRSSFRHSTALLILTLPDTSRPRGSLPVTQKRGGTASRPSLWPAARAASTFAAAARAPSSSCARNARTVGSVFAICSPLSQFSRDDAGVLGHVLQSMHALHGSRSTG